MHKQSQAVPSTLSNAKNQRPRGTIPVKSWGDTTEVVGLTVNIIEPSSERLSLFERDNRTTVSFNDASMKYLQETDMKDEFEQHQRRNGTPTNVQPLPSVQIPAIPSSYTGKGSISSGEVSNYSTTWPYRIGFTTRQTTAFSDQRTFSRNEVQLIAYNAALDKHTRLTIRPIFLLMLLSVVALFTLAFLSFISFLLGVLISSLLSGSPSFHHVNSVLLTLLFIYSLLKQLVEYLRTLAQPKRRVPVNGRGGDMPEEPVCPRVLFHEKSWWSTWNEKDRPR